MPCPPAYPKELPHRPRLNALGTMMLRPAAYMIAQGNAGEPEDHGDEVADQTGDIGTTVTQTEEEQTG